MKATLGITHFNRPKLLNELISKIRHLPNGYDLLIVDDHSDLENFSLLREVLKNSGISHKLLRHEKNLGPGAAKNSLFESSENEYVFVLDSDNAIDSSSLTYLLNYARCQKSDLIATSGIFYFNKKFKVIKKKYQRKPCLANLETFIFGDEIYNNGNLLIARKVWKEVGGYPTHHSLDTQGFGLRLRSHGITYSCVSGSHYYHRRHKDWRKSRFMQTSQAGTISVEQCLLLLEFINLMPPLLHSEFLNYPIFETSTWDKSLFSRLRKTLETFNTVSLQECSEQRITQISHYLNSSSQSLDCSCGESLKDGTPVEKFALQLGREFFLKTPSEKENIVNSILRTI